MDTQAFQIHSDRKIYIYKTRLYKVQMDSSGVFPACVGQNMNFEDSKAMIGVIGFTIGFAEISGAILMILFGKKVAKKIGRDIYIVIAFVLHTAAYGMAYVNLPKDCPSNETYAETIINSRIMAIAIAFLLGFGDALMMNCIFAAVANIFKGEFAPPAFALAFFAQSLASAIAFFYAPIDLP